MTLAGLAERSGLPARTIRFYIARGLINAPAKSGRIAEYTAEHVVRLERIKRPGRWSDAIGDRPDTQRTFDEEVQYGSTVGVVAAFSCRRRDRVGKSRCQPVANEAVARGAGRIRSPREAGKEWKGKGIEIT